MIPKQLTLSGFMSFRDEVTIPFDGMAFTVLTGENGAGKSSVILGLSWVIYGENRVGRDKDSIVHDSEEVATGILDLEDSSGTTWRIRRERTWRSGTELTLAHYDIESGQWISFGDHRIATAQEKIYEIVGMDEDTYHSLMVMKQSSMAAGTRFTAADSNKRRQILMGLLPELAIWSSLEDSAGEIFRETNREVSRLENSITSDSERISSASVDLQESVQQIYVTLDRDVPEFEDEDIVKIAKKALKIAEDDSLQKKAGELEALQKEYTSAIESSSDGRSDLVSQLKTLKAQRQARNAEIKNQQMSLKAEIAEYEGAQKSVVKAEEKVAASKKFLDKSNKDKESTQEEVEEFSAKLVKFRPEVPEREQEVEKVSSLVYAKKSEVERIGKQLSALQIQSESHEGDAECLVCKSPLTHDQVSTMLGESEQELKQTKSELSELEEDLATARKTLKRASTRVDDLEHDLSEAKQEVKGYERDIKRSEQELVEHEDELKSLKSILDALTGPDESKPRLEALVLEDESDDEQDLEKQVREMDEEHPLSEKLKSVDKDLARQRNLINSLSRMSGTLESEINQVEVLQKSLKESNKLLTSKLKEKAEIEWIRYSCSQKGVPSMLIGDVLGSIEEEQNNLLERLMGDRAMQVSFRQERELKSREGTESVLDIVVETPDGWERPIESFSGGEQVRLTFSNLFAMLKVFNERQGNLVNTLFLDEPLGAIDRESVPVLVDIIRDAIDQGIVQSVFIVAHEQAVIDAIPQRMEFFRNDTGTTDYEVF